MKIACIIPTYNGKKYLETLFASLKMQDISFDIFVVDSESHDGTYELSELNANCVTSISLNDFNHGGTRQLVVDKFSQYEAYVFLTQDAVLFDSQGIKNIIAPLSNAEIGAVCGRQLPHLDANPFASHARLFNYPDSISIKAIEDVPKLGIKTAFMSNSFAAYRASALKEVGGFPSNVIFGEDMYVAAKMLLSGWKVAYAGNALCRHSHNYSLAEEFRRYFDMGVFHFREPWIKLKFGGTGGEGLRFVRSELIYLGVKRFFLWPESLVRNAVKLFAYKLGQKEDLLPLPLKRKIGMHRRYWDEQS